MMIKISSAKIPVRKNRIMALIVHYVLKLCFYFYQFLSLNFSHKQSDLAVEKIDKVLVIRTDRLGDIVTSTPAFKAIRDIFPNLQIVLLAASVSKDLVEVMPTFDRIIYFDAPWIVKRQSSAIKKLLKIIRQLRKEEFDLAVDLRGDFRNNILMFLCNAKYRIGYDITGCQYFLTNVVPLGKDHHPVNMALSLIRYLMPSNKKLYKMSLWVTKQDREFATDFLTQNGIVAGSNKPIVMIHPGARWSGRQWIPERYAQIVDLLIGKYGVSVIICGSFNEKKLVNEITNLMKHKPIVAAGKASLREFLALLEKSDLFIGLDSGPTHMAVAMGVKVIALYGAARPEAVGPYGDEHIVVTKQHLFPCSPCSQTLCKRGNENCMQAITVEDVWKAIEVQMKKLILERLK